MVSQPSDDFLLLAATVIAQLAADSARELYSCSVDH